MFDVFSHIWTKMLPSKGFVAVVLVTFCLCLSDVSAVSRTVVFKGNSAELECEVEGAVITIYWQKGDELSKATTVASFEDGTREGSDGGRISMSPSWSLMINDVSIEDESQYFCVVTLTSSTNEDVTEAELVVAVPPAEPYPTLVLLEPTSSPSQNASCQYTIPQGTQYRLSCDVASFRPSVEILWFVDNASEGGSPLKYADNEDGTKDAYGRLDVTMGGSNMEVRCEVSGEAVPDPPRTANALICWTPNTSGGGNNTTTIAVIVVIVIILIAAVIGIALWMRILIKDTMVRSNYSKTVSADDDTPSRTRLSNFCHICCAACCPCRVQEDDLDTETQRRSKPSSSSHANDEREKKPKAPSAALKARIQQNRKKQEGKAVATAAESDQVPSDKPHEHAPMLEDPVQTSTPVNSKPPGARPKTRPIDDASVVIRVPHQASHSRGQTNGAASGEAETGF